MTSNSTALEVTFHATAREYFKVWIVNVCLSLLTLGVYAPWAKVRTRRYFYGRTLLDGTAFRYRARPFTILKGRLVATLVLAGFYVATEIVLEVRPYARALALLALPWIVLRALCFEAGHSSYRNVPFEFDGEYVPALRALLGAALLAVTFLGFPWAHCRLRSFLVRHVRFGGVRARLKLRGERLFARFVLASGIAVASLSLALVLLFSGREGGLLSASAVGFALSLYLGLTWAHCVFSARAANLTWAGTVLGPLRFEASLRARDLFFISVTNTLAILASLGLLVPWAKVRATRYRIARLKVFSEGDWRAFRGDPSGAGAPGHALGEALTIDLEVSP